MKKIRDMYEKFMSKMNKHEDILDKIIGILFLIIMLYDVIANVVIAHTPYQFHMAQMIWFYGVMIYMWCLNNTPKA